LFAEKESYYVRPYLQRKTSFMEDKDKDLFLLGLPYASNPVFPTTIDLNVSNIDPSTPSPR